MNITVYFDCPFCDRENSTEFDLGEHFADVTECEECGHVFSNRELYSICQHLDAQAMGTAIDRATDRDR